MRIAIDDIDRRIIELLQEDVVATNTAIAAMVGVSDVTVAVRIRRLIENRAVHPTVFVNPFADGRRIYVVAEIRSRDRDVGEIARELSDIEALQTVIRVVGGADIMVLFFAREPEDVERIRQQIAAVPGITTVDVSMSLKLHKFHTSYGPYGMLMSDE